MRRVPFVYRLQRKLSKDTMEKRIGPPTRTPVAMYCNNCGGKGHLFRMCSDPVLSCGIVLLESAILPVVPDTTRLLMIRRKDSMSFAEFMRGKYDPAHTDYVSRLIGNMTIREQKVIVLESFETAWRSVWGDDHLSADFVVSQQKFSQLNVADIVANNPSPYEEPEWGFPKGRRIRGESDVDCALREFGEETNIPRESFTVLKNIRIEETFEGLNGIQYKHVYFVALLQKPEMVNLSQRFTSMQRREISGIEWKTWAECENHIRPHHVQRKAMMDDLRSIVQTFETV